MSLPSPAVHTLGPSAHYALCEHMGKDTGVSNLSLSTYKLKICVCKTQITLLPPLFSFVAPALPVFAVAALTLPVAWPDAPGEDWSIYLCVHMC